MQLEFAHIQENIAQCEALQEASDAVCAEMDERIEVLERIARKLDECLAITSGKEIQPEHPTSADTPRGLLCVATDGERNGRLAWVPGARN